MSLLQQLLDTEVKAETKEMNRAVLILYDKDDPTLLQTGHYYSQMYKDFVDNRKIWLMSSKLSTLSKFIDDYKDHRMIIHYVGHGVNNSGKFPALYFERRKHNIIPVLKNLNLNIILIIDACNVIPHGESRCAIMTHQGIELLFTLEGMNIICSSKRGWASYYIPGKQTLFFEAFESAISNPVSDITMLLQLLNQNLINLYVRNSLKPPDDGLLIDFELTQTVDEDKIRATPLIRSQSTFTYNGPAVSINESHYVPMTTSPVLSPSKKRKLDDDDE